MANDFTTVSIAATEAEECLLGSILIESCRGTSEAIKKVSSILQVTDFKGVIPGDKPGRWGNNARIYYAMLKCELPPHTINTALSLVKLDLLNIHDPQYMQSLIDQVPCSLDYMDYAKAVKEYSRQRQVKYYAEKGNYRKLNELTSVKTRKGFAI